MASVKPSLPITGDSITVTMGGDEAIQNFINVTLRSLILEAYKIKDYQLIGPDWLQQAMFDVSARMPAGATRKQVPAMMQKLLAQRFHLTLHRETKNLPVYALVLAKGGIKTHAPDAKDGPQLEPDGTTSMRGSGAGPGMVDLVGMEMTADDLASLLSHAVDRPVLDKTGLTGSHQFKMRWDAAGDTTLFDAVQEYLGLKLESRKAPVEILVIDHVDKAPVEN